MLSTLSESPKIRIIASIDHVNAPLMWAQRHTEKYNWLWQDATTCARYTLETAHVHSLASSKTAGHGRGTAFVLQSLTKNHVELLFVLAKCQLDEEVAAEANEVGRASNFKGMYVVDLFNL
jgi:origin recognition complex subunit 2